MLRFCSKLIIKISRSNHVDVEIMLSRFLSNISKLLSRSVENPRHSSDIDAVLSLTGCCHICVVMSCLLWYILYCPHIVSEVVHIPEWPYLVVSENGDRVHIGRDAVSQSVTQLSSVSVARDFVRRGRLSVAPTPGERECDSTRIRK